MEIIRTQYDLTLALAEVLKNRDIELLEVCSNSVNQWLVDDHTKESLSRLIEEIDNAINREEF